MSSSEENFQARASRVGREFKEECKNMLSEMGFEFLVEAEPFSCGVQVELMFNNRRGITLLFEATGTLEEEPISTMPGLERTDSVKKIICTAYLVQREMGTPTIILTSHKAIAGSASAKMLDAAGSHVIFDVISIKEDDDLERLQGYLTMDENDFERLSIENR